MNEHQNQKLDEILRLCRHLASLIATEGVFIMSAIDDLATQVQANTDAEQSAIVLLQGLKAALDAAGTDPTKLAALRQQLTTSQAALAAAIVANTPAAAR